MKLAEALVQRSDITKRLEQLKARFLRNAKVQEGDEPAEDPANLNQLARHANSWRGNADAALLAAEVAAIRVELRRIFDPEVETGKGGC